MEILRLFLFSGFVFRRVLLEILKKKGNVYKAKKQGPWLIKSFKVSIQVFLGFQILFLDLFPILEQPTHLKILGFTIFLIGLATTMVGRLHLGTNWANLEDYQVLSGQSLVTKGIYRYIRHPIYTGDLLLFLGLELALNSWLVLGIFLLIPISLRQVLLEEALLSRTFNEYDVYRKRTKRFIPFTI